MGNKSKNLKILQENNFLVPDFLVVNICDNFEEKIKELDKNKKYVVRSDMLVEDSKNSSMAGQFKTIIDIDFGEIIKSINEVINHALNKGLLKNEVSIIVQEYIELDYSGIIFTRNPIGDKEMIIEYFNGIGENIVGGKVLPKKICLYHNEKDFLYKFYDLKNILNKNEILKLINNIKKIEILFNFPQDIEWGIYNGKIYFLQSRNITTISNNKYEEILFLENELKNIDKYFYEKKEVSEIAERPVLFTYSLLQKLYSKNGVIDNFYKKRNIKVASLDFLKIIGNELYVNRELELKNIFPSLTYLKNKNYGIRFNDFKGLFLTINNLFFILFMKYDKKILSKKLHEKLEKPIELENTLDILLNNFYSDYEIIYEINYFTGKSFKKLEQVLKNEKFTFVEAINLKEFIDKKPKYKINTGGFIGNSLDISDESKFINIINNSESNNIGVKKCNSMSKWKKLFLKPYIEEAIFMQNLREEGRNLTVKNISIIRKKILLIGNENNIYNIYFYSINEILESKFNKKILNDREQLYKKYDKYNFPKKLQDIFIENNLSKLLGISGGIVEGVIVGKTTLNNYTGKKILLVDILSPDLVEYFDEVEGIISKTGGLLSHLSILAREQGIAVVSGYNDGYMELLEGDMVKIDGSIGKIEKLF